MGGRDPGPEEQQCSHRDGAGHHLYTDGAMEAQGSCTQLHARPSPRHSRLHHSPARRRRSAGARSWGRFELARRPPLPPSPPHPALSPHPGQGPGGLRGAGSPRTQGPGRAPRASRIFHCTAPGALRGVRGETGRRQSHGPPRSPSPARPSPAHASLTLSDLPSSLPLCERGPARPTPPTDLRSSDPGQARAELD